MTSKEFALLHVNIRDKVCENNRYNSVEDNDWAESIVESFKEEMAERGIDAETVYWSGFCSQGDGACFAGGIDDLKLFIESHEELAEFALLVQTEDDGMTSIRMWWKHDGYYYHENSLTYSCEDGFTEVVDADFESPVRLAVAKQIFADAETLLGEFENAVRSVVQQHCSDFYKNLEKEYDYFTSDEVIIESLEANDGLADEVATAKEQLEIEEDEHQSC